MRGEHAWAKLVHLLVATDLGESWQLVERGDCANLELDLAYVGLVFELTESLLGRRSDAVGELISNILKYLTLEAVGYDQVDYLAIHDMIWVRMSRKEFKRIKRFFEL